MLRAAGDVELGHVDVRPKTGHREYGAIPNEAACVAKLEASASFYGLGARFGETAADRAAWCASDFSAGAPVRVQPAAADRALAFVVVAHAADDRNLGLCASTLASVRSRHPASRVVVVDNASPRGAALAALARAARAECVRQDPSGFELGGLAAAAPGLLADAAVKRVVFLQHSTRLRRPLALGEFRCRASALFLPWFRYETNPKFRDSRWGMAPSRAWAGADIDPTLVASPVNARWVSATHAAVALSRDALAEIVAAGLLDPGVTRACQRKVCAEHVMGLYSARLNSSIEDLACVVPGAAAKIHGNN